MSKDPYADHPHCRPTQGPRPGVGEVVHVQQAYELIPGKVVKLNRTTATVHFERFGFLPHDRRVPYEKLARADEMIACICEYWRGQGYRIDRSVHAEHLLPASALPIQGYLCENAPGELAPGYTKQALLEKGQHAAGFAAAIDSLADEASTLVDSDDPSPGLSAAPPRRILPR